MSKAGCFAPLDSVVHPSSSTRKSPGKRAQESPTRGRSSPEVMARAAMSFGHLRLASVRKPCLHARSLSSQRAGRCIRADPAAMPAPQHPITSITAPSAASNPGSTAIPQVRPQPPQRFDPSQEDLRQGCMQRKDSSLRSLGSRLSAMWDSWPVVSCRSCGPLSVFDLGSDRSIRLFQLCV
jgi:hypothetical protein